MPAHKKKATTSTKTQATSTVLSTEPLKPETFHQYLRAEIRHGTRAVMQEIMREELSQFLQADWGESTPERKGYRNGFYSRDLMTTAGPIEDLNVPRDREGQFHTQAFEQYRGSEPQVAEGLTQMFLAGASPHQVGEVAQTLIGVAGSREQHRHIQTTNAIEGFFSNVRQRTDQIETFPTQMSCLTIVWALMQDIRFHKIAVS